MAIETTGHSIIKNSSWSAAAFIAYTALLFISAPAYIHFLGISQYGIFVLLNSVIAPLGLLNMGMGQAAVKYIAESVARNRLREANGYLQATFVTTSTLGGVGVIGVISAAHLLTSRVFSLSPADQQVAYRAVPWVAITWLLTQLSAQFTSVPTAMQKYNIASTGIAVCGAATLGMGLVVLWMGGNLLNVLEVRAVTTGVTVIGWCIVAKRMLPALGLRFSITRLILRRCMKFGIWQSVALLGGVAANNADKALLGMYASDVAVGLFAIPQTIVTSTYSLIIRAAEVLLPAVSEIDLNSGRERSFLVAIRAGWVLSLVTTAAMGCLVVMGSDLLRLYVGRSTAAGCGRLLVLIALTAIASSGSVALNQYLLGIGDTKRTAVIAISSGVVGVLGGALLIPKFGLNGAAIADASAIALVRPVMQYLIWRDAGKSVPYSVFASYLYGPALVGIPLSLALRGLRNLIQWECGWFGLAICSTGCCVIMVAGVILFNRILPDWKQRELDSEQVLRHVWGVPRRILLMAACR